MFLQHVGIMEESKTLHLYAVRARAFSNVLPRALRGVGIEYVGGIYRAHFQVDTHL